MFDKISTEKKAEWARYRVPEKLSGNGCFGFVDGHLMLGNRHHQAIMARLLGNGWTWEDLMTAEQIWGWYYVQSPTTGYEGPPKVVLDFVSDAAYLHRGAVLPCKKAFKELFKVKSCVGAFSRNRGDVSERGHGDYGGDFDRHYGRADLKAVRGVLEATPVPEKVKV